MLSMAPNIVFAPNITQNTDTGRKTQTQLITGLVEMWVGSKEICILFRLEQTQLSQYSV